MCKMIPVEERAVCFGCVKMDYQIVGEILQKLHISYALDAPFNLNALFFEADPPNGL